MKIETYLYLGNWTELENFVRYKLPHNEDLCFFSTGDIANPKTYIVFRESISLDN